MSNPDRPQTDVEMMVCDLYAPDQESMVDITRAVALALLHDNHRPVRMRVTMTIGLVEVYIDTPAEPDAVRESIKDAGFEPSDTMRMPDGLVWTSILTPIKLPPIMPIEDYKLDG